MSSSIDYIIAELKSARKRKGMSQRELSKKTKIPQGHLSNIERGKVDLHVSSLVEISRVLDLEVMLVPQQLRFMISELQKTQRQDNDEQIPMYRLNSEDQ